MLFKKIRETVAAFKSEEPGLSKNKYISKKHEEMQFLISVESKANTAVNLAITIIMLLPCVWLFNYLIHSILKSYNLIYTGLTAIILTLIFDRLRERIFAKIPFYKLNPYFGNKLEETINAFRKR